MNRLGVLLFVVALGISACKTTQTPDGGVVSTVVSDVVHCADEAVHKAALGLLDDVASVLTTGNWEAGLADLAGRFGVAAVTCAVQEVAGQSSHMAQATNDPTEALKAARGRQWMATHPAVP